jgi:hypothetical protein
LDSSIVQGPFSVAPCQTLANITIRNFCIARRRAGPAPPSYAAARQLLRQLEAECAGDPEAALVAAAAELDATVERREGATPVVGGLAPGVAGGSAAAQPSQPAP